MTTILIVEDAHDIADLLSALLEEEGYQTVTASNGREALASMTVSRPDLVLCDVKMPVMGGIELSRTMQANPGYDEIPILFMSAAGNKVQDDVPHVGFITKPFDVAALLDTIAEIVDGSAHAEAG